MYQFVHLQAECAPSIIPVVEDHLLQETDSQVKAYLLLYPSYQPDYAQGDDQWLRDRVNAVGEHPLVRTVTAMLHVRRAKEQTSPESAQVLLETLIHPETVEDLYRPLPWAHGDFHDAPPVSRRMENWQEP